VKGRKDDRQMTDKDAGDLVISVEVDDAVIAERIVRLLGNVRGIRLSSGSEAADLTIIRQSPPESGLGLTPREKDVLVLLAEGASNKAIARQLGISVHTAKFHVGSLLEKFDATGRTDVVAHAARLGVIHL
jgi:DNA-binding CsgD family transcriptional regulator